MKMQLPAILLSLLFFLSNTAQAKCPDILQHKMKKLHSSEIINLCERFSNKPLLIINTASHCGYTRQFKDLETLYQQYSKAGVEFIGVTSDSFNQAAKSEAEAASICYKNYGVSFTMLAPVPVKGKDAHPLFKQLATNDPAPSWNFNKYLVNREGEVVKYFRSSALPDDADMKKALVF